MLFSKRTSAYSRFDTLRDPDYHLAENCRDFNQNISSVSYPMHKRLFFPEKGRKNISYVIIHNIGMSIQEENPFVTKVRLHDSTGEVNLVWTDPKKFENARAQFIIDTELKIGLQEAKEKADRNPSSEFDFFSPEELVHTVSAGLRNYLVQKFVEDNLRSTNMTLYNPYHTVEMARDKQGLRDEDHVYEVIFAYLTKQKIGHVCRVQKKIFTRPRRAEDIVVECSDGLAGSLLPVFA